MINPMMLDIETIPTEAALAMPYPATDRNPPANYKSDEAITKWRATDEANWREGRIKECSLNPRLGRVLCVGTDTGVDYAVAEADESEVLDRFWWAAAEASGDVVTWNGAWDLRFLVVRSLICGVVPSLPSETIRAWFRKYTVAPHFDCKAILLTWDVRVAGEGLDEWAQALGLEGKTDGVDGSKIYDLFTAGQHDTIRAYCAADVASTQAIYRKIAPMFG